MRTRSKFIDTWHSDLWGLRVRVLDYAIAKALLAFRAEWGRWPKYVRVVDPPVNPMATTVVYRPAVDAGDTFEAVGGDNNVWCIPATLDASAVQDALDAGVCCDAR